MQSQLFGGGPAQATSPMGQLKLQRSDNKVAGNLFGAGGGSNPAQNSSLFGGGGQPAALQKQGSLFGGQSAQPNTSTGGGLFGGQGAQGSTGGQGQGGLFGGGGATQQQQAQPQGRPGLFNQPTINTGGGLFGGASQQPAAGNPSQPGAGGLFGGAQAQPAAATGLFGGASAASKPAGGLFGAGGATAPAAGGGLFGGAQAQQPAAGGGLFGATLGGQTQPQGLGGAQQPLSGFGVAPSQAAQASQQAAQQQMINSFMSPQFIAMRKQQEQQAHLQEISDLINNYTQISGADPASEQNKFVTTFYNKYPDKMPKAQIEFLKGHISKVVQVKKEVMVQQPQAGVVKQEQVLNVPINMDLWLKSYEKNPDPNQLYTTQICSTKDLLDRTQQICGKLEHLRDPTSDKDLQDSTLDKVTKRLTDIITPLKKANEAQSKVMQDNLDISKQKNQQIQSALIRIFGKFEKLMHYEGRVETRDTAKRDMLLNAQRNLLNKIRDPNRGNGGLLVRLEDIQSTLRQSEAIQDQIHQTDQMNSNEQTTATSDRRNSITDEDLDDMFKVLKKQKQGLDVLTESVNESTRQLMVMERELDLNCQTNTFGDRR